MTVRAAAAATGSLDKGLALLQLVAERGSVAVADVSGGLGLSRSSSYRLVNRLRSAGYLQDAAAAGTIRLGPLLVPIGLAALNQMDVMDVAPGRLVALAHDAGETVNLGVPQRDEMVYVYQAEGPGAVKVTARLGSRRPQSCSALGKAYLAALGAAERAQRLDRLSLVRLTEHSIVDAAAFAADLAATVERGYALDEQEAELGVACVGAAIRDYTGRPIAAISIAGPAERMPEKCATVVSLVTAAAVDISHRLGFVA